MLYQFKKNKFWGFQPCLYQLISQKPRCCHPCNNKQQLSVLLIRRWRIIITQFWLRRKRIKLLAGDVIVLFHSLIYIIKSLLCVMFFLHLLIDEIQSLQSLLTPSCSSCFLLFDCFVMPPSFFLSVLCFSQF